MNYQWHSPACSDFRPTPRTGNSPWQRRSFDRSPWFDFKKRNLLRLLFFEQISTIAAFNRQRLIGHQAAVVSRVAIRPKNNPNSVPNAVAPTVMPKATRAASRPYSMAVAPLSSWAKRLNTRMKRFMSKLLLIEINRAQTESIFPSENSAHCPTPCPNNTAPWRSCATLNL